MKYKRKLSDLCGEEKKQEKSYILENTEIIGMHELIVKITIC